MDLIELTPDYEVTEFDCGDEQLNKFLFEDAKPSLALRVANTFILVDDGRVAAYFCLLNDKVSKDEIIGSRWKKVRANFPQSKQFRSYPTIKIGRFAVSINYRGKNIGTDLMDSIKAMLHAEHGRSAFRFITVDAYLSAVPFYEKGGTCDVDNIVGGYHGFLHLTKKDEDEHTRLMYFDMMEIAE